MMPKPNNNQRRTNNRGYQQPTEQIIYQTKPNLFTYPDNFITKIIVVFMLALLFAPLTAVSAQIQYILMTTFQIDISQLPSIVELLIILCMIIVIIKIGLDVADRNKTTYTLTQNHIIIERGIFRHEKLTMPYDKIQDVEISQNLLERIINVGDVTIYGGHDNSKIILDDTPSPQQVEALIAEQQDKIENQYRTYQQPQYQQPQYQQPQYQQPQYQQPQYQQPQYQQPQYQQPQYQPNQYQQRQYKPNHYEENTFYENPNTQYENYQNKNKYKDEIYFSRKQKNSNTIKDKYEKRKQKNLKRKQDQQKIIQKHQQMFKKQNKKE